MYYDTTYSKSKIEINCDKAAMAKQFAGRTLQELIRTKLFYVTRII